METRICELCGQPVQGATTRYCIPCYRRCCQPCRTCLDNHGDLRYEFQNHEGPGPEKDCPRCKMGKSGRHSDRRQLECPKCHGDRVIFTPVKLEGAAHGETSVIGQGVRGT